MSGLTAERGGVTPVFVVSPGRTGTTLMMKALAGSPDVWVPGEYPNEDRYLAFLSTLAALGVSPSGGKALRNLANPPGDEILDQSTQRFAKTLGRVNLPSTEDSPDLAERLLIGLWSGLCEHSASGRRFYAEKSVGMSLPPLVAALKPRMLYMVRDPRDIVVSVREFNRKRGFARFGRDADEDDLSYAVRMMPMYRTMLRDSVEGRGEGTATALTARYEDMVVSLSGTGSRLERWLGIGFDHLEVTDAGEHATSTTPEESMGRWRTELAPDCIEFFEGSLRTLLEAHGYEV